MKPTAQTQHEVLGGLLGAGFVCGNLWAAGMELQSQIIHTLGHKGYERYLLGACRDWAAFEGPRGFGCSVPRGSLTENYSPPSMLDFAGRSQVRAPM